LCYCDKSHILRKHTYISNDHKKLLSGSKYVSDEVLWTFSVKGSVLPHATLHLCFHKYLCQNIINIGFS